MSTLINVTPHFQVDQIYDAALSQGWVAVAAGDEGMVLINPEDGARVGFMTNIPMDGPMLIARDRVFFDTYSGQPDPAATELELSPCDGTDSLGLQDLESIHHSLATNQCLYLMRGKGDLVRFKIASSEQETPESPYGRYEHNDHLVLGIGRSRQGVIVLSRYAGRAEHLVDSLPDDPGRPKARAAVLKDQDFGTRLSGPAVAVRWTYLLSHEKACLLSQHLRNPEVLLKTPVPAALAAEKNVLLTGDGIGRVWAASGRGLDLLAGPGAPACFSPAHDEAFEPVRLIADERFGLVTTATGQLYKANP